MVKPPDKEKSLEVRPCVGGLQTKYPSALIRPSQSPDCLNLLYDRMTQRRRDGCVPVNRFLAPGDSLRNLGKTFIGRDGANNFNFKTVPGHGIIGHRPIFSSYRDPSGVFANLTVSFLVMPEPNGDDYSEPANWFTWNTNAAGAQKFAGYRPICSKGPLRSNEYQGTGVATDEGLGWSIGIYNNNGGAGGGPFAAAGTAVWYALVQTNPLAAPILIRSSATSKQRPRPGHIYRVTLAVTSSSAGSGNARLIISELNGDRTVSTETVVSALGVGVLTVNTGPIEVFDMPPVVLNAPNARGGLNIGTTAWEEFSLRFEGRLQDLSIWNVDKTTNGADLETFVKQMRPLDLTVDQTGLIGYWKPDVPSQKWNGTWEEDQTMIAEGRGIDAPMLLCPAVPKWNRANGRTSLYFNGRTSFCFMPTAVNTAFAGAAAPTGGQDNPAFVENAADDDNSFERLTTTTNIALGHSVSLTFIPDAIEAVADAAHGAGAETEAQCLMFWYGVVKFGISSRGRIYCAAMDANGFAATQFFDPFPGAPFAGVKLVPGQRYTIVYQRTAAAAATLILNTQTIGNPAVAAGTAGATSGLPLMLLGTEDAIDTAPAPDVSSGRENTRATSRIRHFHGRIEDVRIGGAALSPLEAFQLDLAEADLYKDGAKTWGLDGDNTAGAGGSVIATGDRTSSNRGGFILSVPGHISTALTVAPFYTFTPQVGLIILNTASNTTYTLVAEPRPQANGGYDSITSAFGRVSQYFAWWNFQDNSLATNLESRHRTSREYTGLEFIYRQLYAQPDNLGLALPMTLCAREPSQIGLAGAAAILQFYPWIQTTPQELTPRLARGLVPDVVFGNPITLIAQSHPFPSFSPTLAAAGSSLYWLQPPWDNDSPYSPEADPTQTSAFFSGRLWNHLEIQPNTTWDLSTNALMVVQFWMKVPELGVRREIAMNWDGAAVDAYNWRIVLTEWGSLHVEGYTTGPAFWRFGTIASDTASDRFHTPITPGRWHFVTVVMDTAAGHLNQKIIVDGEDQPLDDMVGTYAANWLGGAGKKWIAGHQHDLPFPDSTSEQNVEPFLGWIRDFRVSNAVTTSFLPRTPMTVSGSTISLIPLNDGVDNSVSASGTTVSRGTLRCEEMLPILDGSISGNKSTQAYPYSTAEYINVLYATNGLGPALAVRHTGLIHCDRSRDLDGIRQPFGFRATPMGVVPPGADVPSLTGEEAGGGPFDPVTVPSLNFAVTFFTKDGLESDPVVFSLAVPAGGPWQRIRLNGLPRSLEEHVVARRVYLSTTTATLFTDTAKTADNFTDDVEFSAILGSGPAVTFGHAAPPKARHICIHKGRSYMLNRRDGELELWTSEPQSALTGTTVEGFLTPDCIFRLESPRFHEGTFVSEHLGHLFAGKRDSLFEVAPGDLFSNFQIERVNASKGFASHLSVKAFDNHLFGSAQRGVHVFDGSGIECISFDLDGLWPLVDRSQQGFLSQFGVYFETGNQYWLSFRRVGESFGREIVVFDKVVQDPGTGLHPWALLKTILHSYMAIVEDEVDGSPSIYLGTPEGQVMQFLVGGIDGSRGRNNPATGTAFTLSGTASGGSTSTLTIGAGAFDTMGDGLRGLWVTVTHLNGTVEEVRILSNTGSTLTFQTALAATVANGDTFEVGSYWAYHSTPWLSLTTMSQKKLTRWVDLDFTPNATSLQVFLIAAQNTTQLADPFPWSSVPTDNQKTVDMTQGYHKQPVSWADMEGYYWRMAFGTRGINKPFEVYGWNVATEEIGQRKGLGG